MTLKIDFNSESMYPIGVCLILDFVGTNVLTIIAIVLYVISIIPLFMFKFEHDETNTDVKLELFKTNPYTQALLKQNDEKLMELYGNHAQYPYTYSLTNAIYKFIF